MSISSNRIKPLPTEYLGRRFRSRLEARWAVFFDKLGFKWEYEPEGIDISGLWYLPDFFIPEISQWFEIKPNRGNLEDYPDHPLFGVRLHSEETYEKNRYFLDHFSIIVGQPSIKQNDEYEYELGYNGFPAFCDHHYEFCECHTCGKIGFQFEGRTGRMSCQTDKTSKCYVDHDKGCGSNSSRLTSAYNLAIGYRFEKLQGASRIT